MWTQLVLRLECPRLVDQGGGGDRYEHFCVYLDRKAAVAQERLHEQADQEEEHEREPRAIRRDPIRSARQRRGTHKS
jgi:hypothetical protein